MNYAEERTPPVEPLARSAQTGSWAPYIEVNFRLENSYARTYETPVQTRREQQHLYRSYKKAE